MIACKKSVVLECPRHNDDYDQFLQEYADMADKAYRDSLVLAGLREAEDTDFMRRRWPISFVSRLREFLADNGDGSAAALSLDASLNEAEVKGAKRKVCLVWLGPLARSWLVVHAKALRTFLSGRYRECTDYLGD